MSISQDSAAFAMPSAIRPMEAGEMPPFAAMRITCKQEAMGTAKQDRIALMCAEAPPWRYHRSLIADALLVRGIRTEDITSATSPPGSAQPHP
jgi:hypothetical protein